MPSANNGLEQEESPQGLRAALDGPPAAPWPWGVLHHGLRLAFLAALALAVHLLFPVATVPDFPVLERGMVADRDIIAEVGFSIRKSDAELAAERAEAAAGVVPVFDFRAEAVDTMLARVEGFFSRVDSAVGRARNDQEARRRIGDLLASYGFSVTAEAVEILRSAPERARLQRAMTSAIHEELPEGIVLTADLEDAVASQLLVRREERERLLPRDSILTAPSFYDRAQSRLAAGAGGIEAELLRLIAIRFFEPSIRFNRDATEAARERARLAVSPVKGSVVAGERIVAGHEQVREEELEKLRAYQSRLAELNRLEQRRPGLRGAGAFMVNLLVLSLFGLLLYFFRPDVYRDLRSMVLLVFLLGSLTVIAAVIGRTPAPRELIPIAFPTLAIAALWDGRMALNFALIVAVLLSLQAPFLGATVPFTLVMGGAAAAFSVRVVRRRAQTWVFFSIIAGAYAAAAVALGLLRAQEPSTMLVAAGWGSVNAVTSALLAMGLLPLFESFTRITTDQTLLELGDLNRPLLKRLALEAPGTYAHSINVANLAEAAARGIGANPLLTRVGLYYHDVGKIAKPQYFIENQQPGRNPHDKLKPGTSASVVRGHVLEGLRLADEAKLPDVIKSFIAEHHGTQPISFFYERAQELDPEGELNQRDFVYPGPRPRSKETAIAMLADSVESAARVLAEPSPERIRELVDRIVEGKLAQGQLDETPLTLGELTRIKEEFAAVLSGMHHHRIDYPNMPQPPPEQAAAVAGSTEERR